MYSFFHVWIQTDLYATFCIVCSHLTWIIPLPRYKRHSLFTEPTSYLGHWVWGMSVYWWYWHWQWLERNLRTIPWDTKLLPFSKIQLVVYYQRYVLIGGATTRLYVMAHYQNNGGWIAFCLLKLFCLNIFDQLVGFYLNNRPFVTRRPFCLRRFKKLCLGTASLVLFTRLAVHKQSFLITWDKMAAAWQRSSIPLALMASE